MNGIVWTDDARVADARVVKRYGDRPELFVQVFSLQHEAAATLDAA
jgi:Holliday junction resolvase RusA-like endonuclease